MITYNDKMKGGKFIGNGAYGCAFSPNLPCKREKYKARGDNIGKMFSTHSNAYYEEIRTSKLIKSMDPNNKFTIPYYGQCDVDKKSIQISDEVSQCRLYDSQKEQPQIIYKLGGLDLGKFCSNIDKYPGFCIDDWIVPLRSIIEGLVTIGQNQLIHNDIKPPNVLYEPNQNRLYLIDFGICTTFTKQISNDLLLTWPYSYYPLDYVVTYFMQERNRDPLAQFIEKCKTQFEKSLSTMNKGLLQRIQKFQQSKQNIYSFTSSMYTLSTKDYLQLFKDDFCNKIDIYSLGITIVECMQLLDRQKQLRFRNKKLWQSFEKNILKRMVQFDPRDRMTPSEALQAITNIINKSNNRSSKEPKTKVTKPAFTDKPITISDDIKTSEVPDISPPSIVNEEMCVQLPGKTIKLYLKAYNLPQYGTKAQMCHRLMKYINRKSKKSNSFNKDNCMDHTVKEIKEKLRKQGKKVSGVKLELCNRLFST